MNHPFTKKSLFLSWFAVSLFLLTTQVHAASTTVSDPCGKAEKWTWGPEVPAAWRSQLSRQSFDRAGAIQLFAWSQVLAKTGATPESKAWGRFFVARAYHEMGLKTLADRSYKDLFSTAAGSVTPLSTTVWTCLARLHRESPSSAVTSLQVQFIANASDTPLATDLKNTIIFDFVRRKLASMGAADTADFSAELKLLTPASFESLALNAWLGAHAGNDSQVIQAAGELTQQPRFQVQMASGDFGPSLRLLLARAYFHQQKWKAAVAEYDRIGTNSNEFVSALIEKSWAYLQLKNYPEASGTAHNLLIGKLRGVFAPEPATVIAISLFENCHFPEALKAVRIFKQFNQASYSWLYSWKKSGASTSGLYAEVKHSLDHQSKVPGAITSEWIRSPVFHFHQKVLNQLIDEEHAAGELDETLASLGGAKVKAKATQAAYAQLRELLRKWRPSLRVLQASEQNEIESDFAQRNHQMIHAIADTAENAQLIEAEIFNSAGEDMILAHVEGEAGRKLASKSVAKRKLTGAKLDWGTVPQSAIHGGGGAEKIEIWEDELGSLWSDLQDRCRH